MTSYKKDRSVSYLLGVKRELLQYFQGSQKISFLGPGSLQGIKLEKMTEDMLL